MTSRPALATPLTFLAPGFAESRPQPADSFERRLPPER
jgi:hypothetical protein